MLHVMQSYYDKAIRMRASRQRDRLLAEAVAIAKAAAPYMHPRMNAVTAAPASDDNVETLTDAQLAARIAELQRPAKPPRRPLH
jgi:hypothetical protein